MYCIILWSKTIAQVPNPGPILFSHLDLRYNLHFGRNSQFGHSTVGNLQIHLEQNLQEGLQQTIIGHNLCKNTNEWQNKVLELPGLNNNTILTMRWKFSRLSYCVYFSICYYYCYGLLPPTPMYTVTLKQVYLGKCNDRIFFICKIMWFWGELFLLFNITREFSCCVSLKIFEQCEPKCVFILWCDKGSI